MSNLKFRRGNAIDFNINYAEKQNGKDVIYGPSMIQYKWPAVYLQRDNRADLNPVRILEGHTPTPNQEINWEEGGKTIEVHNQTYVIEGTNEELNISLAALHYLINHNFSGNR